MKRMPALAWFAGANQFYFLPFLLFQGEWNVFLFLTQVRVLSQSQCFLSRLQRQSLQHLKTGTTRPPYVTAWKCPSPAPRKSKQIGLHRSAAIHASVSRGVWLGKKRKSSPELQVLSIINHRNINAQWIKHKLNMKSTLLISASSM